MLDAGTGVEGSWVRPEMGGWSSVECSYVGRTSRIFND